MFHLSNTTVIISLIELLYICFTVQNWYADNGNDVSFLITCKSLLTHWKKHNPAFRCHLNKCHSVNKEQIFEKAEQISVHDEVDIFDNFSFAFLIRIFTAKTTFRCPWHLFHIFGNPGFSTQILEENQSRRNSMFSAQLEKLLNPIHRPTSLKVASKRNITMELSWKLLAAF